MLDNNNANLLACLQTLLLYVRRNVASKRNGYFMNKQLSSGRKASVIHDDMENVWGPIFAKSFAVFAFEILRLAGKQGNGLADLAGAETAESALATAPDWVKKEYARTKKFIKSAKNLKSDEAEFRAKVIRNSLVLALREQGITQAELAKRLKKSPAVISRIFRNPERSRLSSLQKIADALKVDLSDLMP